MTLAAMVIHCTNEPGKYWQASRSAPPLMGRKTSGNRLQSGAVCTSTSCTNPMAGRAFTYWSQRVLNYWRAGWPAVLTQRIGDIAERATVCTGLFPNKDCVRRIWRCSGNRFPPHASYKRNAVCSRRSVETTPMPKDTLYAANVPA